MDFMFDYGFHYMNTDIDQLLDGLDSIKGARKVGKLFVFGSEAFPFLAAKAKSGFSTAAAASLYGKGRIIFLSHESFITPTDNYFDKFHVNCVMWAVDYDEKSKLAPVVIKSKPGKKIASCLTDSGYPTQELPEEEINPSLFNLVIIPTALDISEGFATKLDGYVKNGGGLIVAANAGLLNLTYAKTMPLNKLSRHAGVLYLNEQAQPSLDDDKYNTSTNLVTYGHLSAAASVVNEVLDKIDATPDALTDADENKFIYAISIVKIAANNLDTADMKLVDAIKIKWSGLKPVNPANFTEINTTDAMRIQVRIDQEILGRLFNVEDNYAHPASEHFPGAVKIDGIKSKETVFTIDLDNGGALFKTLYEYGCTETAEYQKKINGTKTSFSDFMETEFYSPPGVKVSIKFLSDEIKAFSIYNGRFELVSQREIWNKYPTINFTKDFSGNFGEFSDPFGGPIQIGKIVTPITLRRVSIKISGAIETPHFFLEKTKLTDWDRIKGLDGPWGYFTAPSLQLKMPRQGFTLIENPEELMLSWQRAIDAFNEFHSVPYRSHKLKVNFDYILRTKNAAMISGHVSGFIRHAIVAANLASVQDTNEIFGFLHEFGHNFDMDWWRFHGGEESTNNINIQYVRTTLQGFPKDSSRAPGPLVKFVGNHSIVEQGSRDVRAWFYYDLFRTFGWNVYFKMAILQKGVTFEGDRLTSITRNDWFLIQFSKLVKRNMASYLDSWGLFTTIEAKRQVEAYKMSVYRAE
ncbi:TRPM8 channel-associated factor 3-like [Folsomia candida]|uniref:TRPM8 channel-associated factor 3-like n=1 Tax=Folsomia candida TaxID=158441 RepID=UPI001604DDA5|nr:TRPM8 channel-associated factor 3-like [Folsomia candida]